MKRIVTIIRFSRFCSFPFPLSSLHSLLFLQRKTAKIARPEIEHVSSSIIQTDDIRRCPTKFTRNGTCSKFFNDELFIRTEEDESKRNKNSSTRKKILFPPPISMEKLIPRHGRPPCYRYTPSRLRCRFRGPQSSSTFPQIEDGTKGTKGPRDRRQARPDERENLEKGSRSGRETRGKREAAKPSVSRYKQSQFPASVRAVGKDFACTTTKRQYSRFRTDPEASKEGRRREEALPLFFKTWTRYFFNKVTLGILLAVSKLLPPSNEGKEKSAVYNDRSVIRGEEMFSHGEGMGLRVIQLNAPFRIPRIPVPSIARDYRGEKLKAKLEYTSSCNNAAGFNI